MVFLSELHILIITINILNRTSWTFIFRLSNAYAAETILKSKKKKVRSNISALFKQIANHHPSITHHTTHKTGNTTGFLIHIVHTHTLAIIESQHTVGFL
jgi:hypothetical protein